MIVVSGSIAFDQIFNFPGTFSDHIMPDKLHNLNVSFLVNDLRKSFGGTAGNIAYTLALLDTKVALLGSAGRDFSPYKSFLEKHNIITQYINISPDLYTSTAFGITDKKSNNIWGFYTGADAKSDNIPDTIFKRHSSESWNPHLDSSKVKFAIIAPQNPKTMLKFVSLYTKEKIPFLFDPGMQLPWLSGKDLSMAFAHAKIIIGNDYEISVMEKKTRIKDLNSLTKKGKLIIKTLSDAGSEISDTNGKVHINPAKVKSTIDPAGAGDAYRSGFVAGFIRGFPLKTCGQMGSLTAAYTVETYGTTTHYFTPSEFEKRYFENYQERLTL